MGFLSKLVGFENSFSKNFTKDIFSKPTRLLTGIDPASTKVWNTVLGRDDKPLVNVYGSPGQQYYDQAQAAGIDTGAAQQFHSIADKVASFYGTQGVSGIGGGAAGATSTSGGSGMGLMDMFSSGSGGGLGSLLGGVIGAAGSYKSAKDSAEAMSQQGQLDPRIASVIFGENGQKGLIGQYQDLAKTPRSGAANLFGNANSSYLANYGGADLDAARYAAYGAMNNTSAPTTTAAQSAGASINSPAWAQGNMVKAPSQNGIDLAPTFQSMLGGGNTDKLMQSLQAGNALTSAQFQQNQDSMTDNLQRNVLSGIRSNSVLAGQYGGSRQGVAEGNAISDFTKQLNQSNTQLGLANSANTSAQLAGAYENGQNRALSAAQGLSGQQYATAFKDADTKNAAEFMNVGTHNNVLQTNAQMAQQNNQFNAGLQQQAGLANQQSQLSTNGQNKSSNLAGAGLLSGLLGGVSNTVNANDNWDITRAGQINSLIGPLLTGLPTQNPVSANSGAAALGGGLAGLGFGSQLAGLFKNMGGSSSSAPAGSYFDGYGYMPK